MNPRVVVFCAWALMLAGMILALRPASASTIIPNGHVGVGYGPNSVRLMDGNGSIAHVGRTLNNPSPRTVGVNDVHKVPVGGNLIDVTARRNLAPLVVKRAAALAVRALPPVAVGVALWDMWDEIRVRPDGSGGLGWDPGVPEETVAAWCTNALVPSSPQVCASSASGAVSKAVSDLNGHSAQIFADCPRNGTWSCTLQEVRVGAPFGSSGAMWTLERRTTTDNYLGGGTPSNWAFWQNKGASSTSVDQCPASTDFSDPAFNIPAGLPPGPDGLCRTGRYDHPILAPDAAARLEQYAPLNDAELRQTVEDLLADGHSIPDATERVVSGPGSVTGTPTTTTTTDPSGTTTTITKTPTTNYTYNGDTITYNIVTVTQTTVNGETTTEVEESNPEESDQCKLNPDSLGCVKLGELPSDQPTWIEKPIIYSPLDLGVSGGCPSPEVWNLQIATLEWGYEPACEVAPVVRAGLLALVALSVGLFLVREVGS